MTVIQKISKTVATGCAATLIGLSAAQAAVVASYTVEVEGGLNNVNFGQAFWYDPSTYGFGYEHNASYGAGDDLNVTAPWAGALDATSGSLLVEIDDTGHASFDNCAGMLSMMCHGDYTMFDETAGLLLASDAVSFASYLAGNSFTYADDQSYSWTSDGASFFQSGYGVSVSYDISAASISAVPLPASLAFLLGGVGLLMGLRKRQA